jgi:nucleotide-binding universal stress UspA family protein
MNDAKKNIGIVVGTDFSETGALALQYGLALARDRDDVELHVVHVVTDAEVEDSRGEGKLDKQSAVLHDLPPRIWESLDRCAKDMNTPPGQTKISVHVRFGKPADTIHQVAVDYDAELIVVGTHGRRGFERMVLGSVAHDLVKTAHCPVFVVRPKDFSNLPKTERPAERDPTKPLSSPPEPYQTHIYVSTQELSWAEHNSDTSGPTGVRML